MIYIVDCFRFLEYGFLGTRILIIGEIFEILIGEKFLKFWNADDADYTDGHGFFN